MFRLWAKEVKKGHIVRDMEIEDGGSDTRTHKIFNAIEKICFEYDLSKPIWLDSTISSFKRNSKTRFYADNFYDEIDFDYLEIEVIEEDY